MLRVSRTGRTALATMAAIALSWCGCTGPAEYIRNGFKVGPNYCRPPAAVALHWIDAADIRVRSGEDLSQWWTVFNDPTLNRLIAAACRQNLSLREAGFRVLQSRAQVGIAKGELFPQQQDAFGSYSRERLSQDAPGAGPRSFDQWEFGFGLAWELDFWGRFRRAVAAAEDQLDASVENYDDVLVTLLGDVAANYVQVRTLQERIRLLQRNVELQQGVFNFIETRFKAGFHAVKLDRDQAESILAQTEAEIPQLEITLRQAANRLCILLGTPPVDLQRLLGDGPIPTAPPEVVLGVPAELLRRRPDVRRAERQAAAQAELIGIAEAELYPAFSIAGTVGYQARQFADLFSGNAFNGSVGPSFQWNILNYGRIANNVRFQDAKFQELVVTYQNTVLGANEEVENGLVTFLQAQRRARFLEVSVNGSRAAVESAERLYKAGKLNFDFNRYALIVQNLVQQQDLLAQSRGQIAQGLIQVYRAMGGGWEIRLGPEGAPVAIPAALPGQPEPAEEVPPPAGAPQAPPEQPPPAPPDQNQPAP